MRRAGSDRGLKEIREDHEEDRSENEVGEAKFVKERRAVRLKGHFRGDSRSNSDSCQSSGAPRLGEGSARRKLSANCTC